MGWVLQLVETGLDNRAQRIDVMEISRSNNLRDIASLGLTLPEAKQLLARVQQAVVAAQARDHAGLRRELSRQGLAAASDRNVVRWSDGADSPLSLRRLWSHRDDYQLATALPVDTGAGPVASPSVRPHALSRRR